MCMVYVYDLSTNQGEMEIEHVRRKDGVAGLAHFLGKFDVLCGHAYTSFAFSSAAC